MRPKIVLAAASAIALLLLAIGFHWVVNRVYVPEGCSLMLRYKGPLIFGGRVEAAEGQFAQEGQIGVLADLRGPGRHFYCPIWWERTVIDHEGENRGDVNIVTVVKPGEVAIVRSAMGEELPPGEFLVDGDFGTTEYKGIMRKAYGPGIYRVHPYAYKFEIIQTQQQADGAQVKYSGWVEIPTGYVGVVTNMAANQLLGQTAGIQSQVLPPGIYPINSKEQQIDIVEIGYRETSVAVPKKHNSAGDMLVDDNGEPLIEPEGGISFPASDGFTIQMDWTSIWGIMPEQAPEVISTFGNVDAVEQKVVLPQIHSICRNFGSKYKAEQLLVGDNRTVFQMDASEAFRGVLEQKDITFRLGLVRAIYIPGGVREPIQDKFIADELRLTRDQQELTAETEADLREAERQVGLEQRRIEAETDKLVAEAIALGDKQVGETAARTTMLVAEIDRRTAELEAQATVTLGEADATALQLEREATADLFRLAVQAFGSPEAYNRWVFASGLPDDVDLDLFWAGEGTFWTDLDRDDLDPVTARILERQEHD